MSEILDGGPDEDEDDVAEADAEEIAGDEAAVAKPTTEKAPAKKVESTKKKTQAKPADGSPFFRNFVDAAEKKRVIPENPNEPLEREQNYSKAEEITRLVNEIQSGEFERSMRDKRYKEIYGARNEGTTRTKSYLDGSGHWEVNRGPHGENLGMRLVDSDFTYNEETGTLEYSLVHTTIRRLANIGAKIGIKGLITGGIGLAIGALTGPAGMAAVLPMLSRVLIGSGLGRLSVEITRMFDRAEREDRAKLEIADIRYHQKTREIGNRVACYRDNHPIPANPGAKIPASGMPRVGTSPQGEPLYHDAIKNQNITLEEWDLRQTQATKDLVNFVYSYERNAIDIQYDSEGRPMVHPTPTANPPGEARPVGSEAQQASKMAADTVVIGDLRTKIEERRKAWERASEIGEAVGSVSFTAYALLNGGWNHIVGNAFNHLKDRFAAGDVIQHVDINGDMITHAVQHTENLGNIYHLNSVGEQMAATGAGSDITHHFGQFGEHVLGSTDAQIDAAFLQQASLQVGAQCAGVLASIGARLGIGELFNKDNERRLAAERDELVQNHEKWRRRLQPDSVLTQMKERAESMHISFPKPKEYWVKIAEPTDPDLDPSDPLNQKRYYLQIVEVHENGWVEVVDLSDPDGIVQQLRLSDMIEPANNYRRINNYKAPSKIRTVGRKSGGAETEDIEELNEDEEDVAEEDTKKTGHELNTADLGANLPEKSADQGASPETKLESGALQIQRNSYSHVESAIGKRVEPNTVERELFKSSEVDSGDHLVIAVCNNDLKAILPEKLLSEITTEIVDRYNNQNIQKDFHESLEKISADVLLGLVPDAKARKAFGLTIAVTRPDGKFYGVWINNTHEVKNNNRTDIYHGHKLFTSSDTKRPDLIYTNNKTRCESSLKDNDRIGIFGKIFDDSKQPFGNNDLIKTISEPNQDISERTAKLYEGYLAKNAGKPPRELSSYFAEYKENKVAPSPVNAVDLLNTEKKDKILPNEEEQLKKSNLPWVEIKLMDETGTKPETHAIPLLDGQIFYADISGKDIFYEIVINATNPSEIAVKPFGIDNSFNIHEAKSTQTFDDIEKFKAWLDFRQATFSADSKTGFEEELLKIKNR
ncbi:MAG: hypothetical protein WCI57_03750 [Candidatus Berkelbacteria bacterium]